MLPPSTSPPKDLRWFGLHLKIYTDPGVRAVCRLEWLSRVKVFPIGGVASLLEAKVVLASYVDPPSSLPK